MNYTDEQIKEISQLLILTSRSSIGILPSEEEFDNIPEPFKKVFCGAVNAAIQTTAFRQMSKEEQRTELLKVLLKSCDINPFTDC